MNKIGPITRRDSVELASHARRQAAVAKSMVSVRASELLADFEEQIASAYNWDEQATWVKAHEAVEVAVRDGNAAIAASCRELGIPAEFAPSIDLHWYGRGQNATQTRRAELRKVAATRIAALEKAAKVQIEARSLEIQAELLSGRLTSEAADRFLASMPSPNDLMPKLELGSIQKELGPG